MKRTVRKYQKERRNNEVARFEEKCSFPGHRDSDFNVFHIKSKLGRQTLFWDLKILILKRRYWDMKKTAIKYQKESRNNQGGRCPEKCSYPGHRCLEFNGFHIKSMLRRQAFFWDLKIWITKRRSWDMNRTLRKYSKERRKNQARRCAKKGSYPGYGISVSMIFISDQS